MPPALTSAGAEDPDRAVVAADGLGDLYAGHAERRGDRGGRDAVREDGGQAVAGGFDVERAQRDQPIEGIAGRMGDVDAVGQGDMKHVHGPWAMARATGSAEHQLPETRASPR